MNERKKLGNEGEEKATLFLEKMGFKIIERNFSCKMGEIDIIAKDKDELVFVEVKTRGQSIYGAPRDAVDKRKKNHIYHVAQYYMMIHHLEDIFCRLDVVEVYFKNGYYEVGYIKNSIVDVPRRKAFNVQEEQENEREMDEFC